MPSPPRSGRCRPGAVRLGADRLPAEPGPALAQRDGRRPESVHHGADRVLRDARAGPAGAHRGDGARARQPRAARSPGILPTLVSPVTQPRARGPRGDPGALRRPRLPDAHPPERAPRRGAGTPAAHLRLRAPHSAGAHDYEALAAEVEAAAGEAAAGEAAEGAGPAADADPGAPAEVVAMPDPPLPREVEIKPLPPQPSNGRSAPSGSQPPSGSPPHPRRRRRPPRDRGAGPADRVRVRWALARRVRPRAAGRGAGRDRRGAPPSRPRRQHGPPRRGRHGRARGARRTRGRCASTSGACGAARATSTTTTATSTTCAAPAPCCARRCRKACCWARASATGRGSSRARSLPTPPSGCPSRGLLLLAPATKVPRTARGLRQPPARSPARRGRARRARARGPRAHPRAHAVLVGDRDVVAPVEELVGRARPHRDPRRAGGAQPLLQPASGRGADGLRRAGAARSTARSSALMGD